MPNTVTDRIGSKRAILSLNIDDVATLQHMLEKAVAQTAMTPTDGLYEKRVEWVERFQRMYSHLLDAKDVHYTDLGI